jgi:hypothetical protein
MPPPPLPASQLAYTWIPDSAPRPLARVGLFLGGLLLGAICCTLSAVVLFNLGQGVSIASILARLVAIGLLVAPIAVGRVADKRLRTGLVLFGALIPVPLAALLIVPNAILM